MIERSVSRRACRGIKLWRHRKAEIRPMPAGGLSVPSCSQSARSYRVSLAGEGRCGCTDWRRRKEPCKHIYLRSTGVGGQAAGSASPQVGKGGAMMAATSAARREIHHRIPRCLLKVYDRGYGPGLEPEDLQA